MKTFQTSTEKVKSDKTKENPLFNEIKELRLQVNSLQSEIQFQRSRKPIFKCALCVQNNISKCTHCFVCGSSDHMKNECTVSQSNNSSGLGNK